MKIILLLCLVIFVSKSNGTGVSDNEIKRSLSRRRRYVSFSEGSTFVATLCATIATVTNFGIYFEGINWGVSYTLPNRTTVDSYVSKKHVKRRRQRRDLYTRFETLVDGMGLDGRSCIYRALCEAPRRFQLKSVTLSEELLRLLFKFPLQYLSDEEPEEHRLYHSAYRSGRQNNRQECDEMFPECTISLIDLALGYYSTDEET